MITSLAIFLGTMGDTSGPAATVLLTQLARRVYRSANDEVLGMRLKPYATLCHLRDQGEMAQQALGELCHLDANNLVLVLNELEAAGQAERRRDPTDRRRHIVAITPAGRRALVRAEQGMASIEDEVLGALGADERASLRELLARALEAEDAPAPAG
jgi:DNA-binding MarR family transcriptional regulator